MKTAVVILPRLRGNFKKIKNVAHILNMYNEIAKNIANAVSFIYEGVKLGDMVLIIESEGMIRRVKEQVIKIGPK